MNLKARRLQQAFAFATDGNEQQAKDFNYAAAVQELPALIRMNGLRASMAFYYAKESGAFDLVYKQVNQWLLAEENPVSIYSKAIADTQPADMRKAFMQHLLALPDPEYRDVQAEALAFAQGLIRFVNTDTSK